MGIVYKRGKNWYIDVRSKGRRIRKRVGPSKRVAELAIKDAEVKIARDQFGFSKNDISLDKLFDLFLDYSKVNHRPKSTERYGNVINNFQRYLASIKNLSFLSEVTTQLTDHYKGYRKSSNGLVRFIISSLLKKTVRTEFIIPSMQLICCSHR